MAVLLPSPFKSPLPPWPLHLPVFHSIIGKNSTNVNLFRVDKQKAAITFERPSAARTALLLQDAHLGTSQVHVSSKEPLEGKSTPPTHQHKAEQTDFPQEDKPLTTVLAGIFPSPGPIIPTAMADVGRILVPWLHSHGSSLAQSNRS